MKEQVEVVIDSNEAAQKPELTEVLILHEDVKDYKIEPMAEGDIQIEDCLFERKTPEDFASSLEEGRLRDQTERLALRDDMNSFILVEGDMDDYNHLPHTDMAAKSLRGMDASIEMRNNIRVKYCSTVENVADMAVRLARKSIEENASIQHKNTQNSRDIDFLEYVFMGVDGVGPDLARKISDGFESLEEAMNAKFEDYTDIRGIGQETASNIMETLNSKSTSKSEDQSDNPKPQRTTVTV